MSPKIYITYLEREGPYVKIWGQIDKNLLLIIENSLRQMTPQFELGDCMMSPELLQPGTLCCAKFKDGNYYRARIVSNHYINKGVIEVIFIDYGNRDLMPVNNLRTMARFTVNLITIPPQAQEFILAGVMHPGSMWDEQMFEVISNEIRFLDLEFQEIARIGQYSLINLTHANQEIATSLIARGLATPVSIPMQQVVLQNMLVKIPNVPRQQEMMVYPKQPSPSGLPSPTSRSSLGYAQTTILTYKSLPLEFGSEHKVFVSYVTDGPCLFSVQLVSMEDKLKQLMMEINKQPLLPLEESPLPGCVCLARSSEDGYICRAVVTNMIDGNFKVFYVDFGNTEHLPFNNLYQIQFKYVIPKVMATRFCLNGFGNMFVSLEMKAAFKTYVTNKILYMRVQSPTPGNGLPLCDLWDGSGVNALDFIKCAALRSYPDPVSLTRGINQEVKVSYVYGCKHFYVQLKNKEDDLNNLMQKLQEVCSASPVLDLDGIEEGKPCNALYTADGMYYRAIVSAIEPDNKIKVQYVDYGNIEIVALNDVKAPDGDLITVLRPQAIECCLNGYQNMELDEERDNIFEELILEQDFNMKVVEIQGSKVLVDLIDKNHYNVASLLLEQIAARRSQVIPALIQDDSTIEVRKRTPPQNNTRKSPREENDRKQNGRNDQNSWRDKPRRSFESNDGGGKQEWREKSNRKFSDNNEGRQEWRDKTNRHQNESGDGKHEWREKPNRNDHGHQREDRFNKKFDSNKNSHHDRNDNSGWGNNNFKSNDDNNDFRKKSRSDFKSNNDFNRNKKNEGSEKSWSGSEKSNSKFRNNKHERTERKPPRHNQRSDNFSSPPNNKQHNSTWNDAPKGGFDKPDYADDAKFESYDQTGKTEKVSVSWFYNPANFYCQIESSKNEFGTLMQEIQSAYKKRKPYDAPPVGCPVIAQFPEDNALYRGTVLEKSFSSCKVFYVDFGNVAGAKSVYRIEKKHLTLPTQAYRCSIKQISPAGDKWPDPDSFSAYFEKESFECTFVDFEDNRYNVDLSHNNSDIREQLIKEGLALEQSAPVGELTVFDNAILIGQTIRCQLASVNNLSDILLQFKPGVFLLSKLHNAEDIKPEGETTLHNLLSQNVIVYVENVLDNRLEVVFYDNFGYRLDLYNTEATDFLYVVPVLPTPVLTTQVQGYISHLTDTAIYVLPSIYSDEINKLLDELYSSYENSEATVTEPGVGYVYAALSPDGNWYRGTISSINEEEGTVNVFYLDYGNSEDVQITSLRILCEKHFEPHALAFEISHIVDPSMLQQEITIDIQYIDDKWAAVTTENISEQQAEQPTETESQPQMEPIQENVDLTTEEETPVLETTEQPCSLGFSVYLSHCDNPGQFYLQLSEALDSIDELQEQLQTEAPNLPDVENITTGILCAAPFTLDELWYRAQVLDTDSSITTVRYVDYGNTDVLDNTQSKVKTLPAELLALEHHAKRCSLYLSPIEEEWSTECCERFNALTIDKNLTAEILHQDEKTSFVELYADGVNVAKVLIEEQLAVELQLEISAGPCTGFVSHLNSPSEFWIQLEAACSDLEWIADQLTNGENYPQLENMEPGSLCAAVFPEDDCWYRARILSNTVAGLEVLFIDYGNSCTCSSLRELPEELVLMPPLAQKCSLQKPLGLLQWSQAATETFKDISADGITIFSINKVTQGETSIVQLLLEGEDISNKLLPATFDGIITKAESIDDFTVKNLENEEVIEHCKMDCLPGYVWNEHSGKDFLNICNDGDPKFKVEKVNETSVRLYLEDSDIRAEIAMTRSTPTSSVHSSPRKTIDAPKTDDLQLVEEEPVEILKEKIDQLDLDDEEVIIIEEEAISEEKITKDGADSEIDEALSSGESIGSPKATEKLDTTNESEISDKSEGSDYKNFVANEVINMMETGCSLSEKNAQGDVCVIETKDENIESEESQNTSSIDAKLDNEESQNTSCIDVKLESEASQNTSSNEAKFGSEESPKISSIDGNLENEESQNTSFENEESHNTSLENDSSSIDTKLESETSSIVTKLEGKTSSIDVKAESEVSQKTSSIDAKLESGKSQNTSLESEESQKSSSIDANAESELSQKTSFADAKPVSEDSLIDAKPESVESQKTSSIDTKPESEESQKSEDSLKTSSIDAETESVESQKTSSIDTKPESEESQKSKDSLKTSSIDAKPESVESQKTNLECDDSLKTSSVDAKSEITEKSSKSSDEQENTQALETANTVMIEKPIESIEEQSKSENTLLVEELKSAEAILKTKEDKSEKNGNTTDDSTADDEISGAPVGEHSASQKV